MFMVTGPETTPHHLQPILGTVSDETDPALFLAAKLVCVDDDATALERLRLLLTKEGFEVLPHANTTSALECIWARLPDVLIIDPMMASMSGFALCRQVRDHPETERIPIVLHTTAPAPAEKKYYDCICVKPAELSVLVLAIRTLLMSRA